MEVARVRLGALSGMLHNRGVRRRPPPGRIGGATAWGRESAHRAPDFRSHHPLPAGQPGETAGYDGPRAEALQGASRWDGYGNHLS